MKIAEASKRFNLTNDTLRYYEKIGLIKASRKNGIRDYSEEEINRIEFIKCMRSAGLSIDFLVKYIKLVDIGASTIGERKKLLLEQKEILTTKIKEMQSTLERLDYKITNYESLFQVKK